ncbi:MAG: sugar phosphate isomerase/epimerase [Bacteroidales bacterium]|nr:sugar phosphate isomerase/epimerase [Bacteroidales bacterium]
MRKIALFAIAAVALASCAAPKEQEAAKKEIGIELYSVRDLIGNPEKFAKNSEATLKAIADYGYTSVEAACYGEGKLYGLTGEEFKAAIKAAGLKTLSSHVVRYLEDEEIASGDFSAAMPWWEEAIACHKAAGMKYMVAPGINIPDNLKDLKVVCDYMNAIGKLVKENGMQFGYHNHSHEFNEVEGVPAYDFMVQNTDPELVFFQMDVYWADNARVSPVEYFKKYPGRFTCLHIKDVAEVGQSGKVGFDAIFGNFETSGTQDIVVEMEGSSYPEEEGGILRTCKESAEYLIAAPFVK